MFMQIHIITNTDKETKFKCERMLHCLNLIVRALPSHSYVFFYISEYLYLFLENGKLIISISDQYKLSDLQKTIILASAKFSYETLVYFPRTSVLKDKTEQTSTKYNQYIEKVACFQINLSITANLRSRTRKSRYNRASFSFIRLERPTFSDRQPEHRSGTRSRSNRSRACTNVAH